MGSLSSRFDELAGVEGKSRLILWLERSVFAFLVLMVLSAPHSIAATQTAWLTGMFLWLVLSALRRKLSPIPTSYNRLFRGLNICLWMFFVWSFLTSLTSYAPDISIDKLRGASVFLIFYFVYYNAQNLRALRFLALVLIASCMVNVLWVPVQRLIGRGVEIHGLAPDGAMSRALLTEGDTLLEANGRKLRSPDDLLAAVEQSASTKVKFYRPDFDFVVEVKRSDLVHAASAGEQLGFASWKKSRNWRSSGFYGHYTTYAEVLQLIASLAFGLLIAWLSLYFAGRTSAANSASAFRQLLLMAVALGLMCLALLLTVTRASQLAFMISAAVIVIVGLGRKWLLRAVLIALPLALIGLLFLQQSRQVGFFDTKDDSIKWRQTVWSEGYHLWTNSPRNFVLGVGMDSIKRYAPEWHLFDDGRLNMGHFHSTPLQLLIERGLPSLLLWLGVLAFYWQMLWNGLRRMRSREPYSRGILLGSLGGSVGFFVSGLVHYNLGDQEVAMVFFLLVGLSVRLTLLAPQAEVGNV